MAFFIMKSVDGNFDFSIQPKGFAVVGSLENRMFIVECGEQPVGDFVAEFPEEQKNKLVFYPYDNGKWLPFDPFDKQVVFSEEVDKKNRRAIQYNQAQLDIQLSIMKWLLTYIWLPDKDRMYDVSDADYALYLEQINALSDPGVARTYIRKNFYYNL